PRWDGSRAWAFMTPFAGRRIGTAAIEPETRRCISSANKSVCSVAWNRGFDELAQQQRLFYETEPLMLRRIVPNTADRALACCGEAWADFGKLPDGVLDVLIGALGAALIEPARLFGPIARA